MPNVCSGSAPTTRPAPDQSFSGGSRLRTVERPVSDVQRSSDLFTSERPVSDRADGHSPNLTGSRQPEPDVSP